MRALATPAAVLLLGGVTTDAVRVTHDVNFDAALFRSTVVARPRIDLYAEHRKFGYHLRGGDSEVIGGEREVPLVPENNIYFFTPRVLPRLGLGAFFPAVVQGEGGVYFSTSVDGVSCRKRRLQRLRRARGQRCYPTWIV